MCNGDDAIHAALEIGVAQFDVHGCGEDRIESVVPDRLEQLECISILRRRILIRGRPGIHREKQHDRQGKAFHANRVLDGRANPMSCVHVCTLDTSMADRPTFIPLDPPSVPDDPVRAAGMFREFMSARRSVREFSSRDVPRELIEEHVGTAGTAPSGANKQPWSFVAVRDPDIKREIRQAAEVEEREFYARRASETWLRDLHPFGTDEDKPFLETAPWLIVVFKCMKALSKTGVNGVLHFI